MLRNILNISEIGAADVDTLLAMARDGLRPGSLAGVTVLVAFFQQSTRTRLGFMSAAARQGAAVLDLGSIESLRIEPVDDQLMVLAHAADVVVVRHGDQTFASRLAATMHCAVINAGAGRASHPTQALVDAYTFQVATGRELRSVRVLLLGDSGLRSAQSFKQLGKLVGISIRQFDPPSHVSDRARDRYRELLGWADVVYIKPSGSVDYESSDLNVGRGGQPLPGWVLRPLLDSDVYVMHALPRGAELPDKLMRSQRCLALAQIECGLPMRSAILRWTVGGG